MGVPSRPPSSYSASDRRDVHCGGRGAFSRLARRREVSHLARLGLVLRIRAAFADCVLPSGALLLIECLVLRGLEEGRPALLRTVATNRGGRRLAGRPFTNAYVNGVPTHPVPHPSRGCLIFFWLGRRGPSLSTRRSQQPPRSTQDPPACGRGALLAHGHGHVAWRHGTGRPATMWRTRRQSARLQWARRHVGCCVSSPGAWLHGSADPVGCCLITY
jgi:hypothetical protein